MDRRQKKLERKRKQRAVAKKKARALGANRPDREERVIAAAGRAPFGPCFISPGWDDAVAPIPALVTVVVTRRLAEGDLVAGIALVDRTCFGIKNANTEGPLSESKLDDFLDQIGEPHGGMEECELQVARSVIYHALDYARRLGFGPHRDFREAVFGPRPDTLVATALHNVARPVFVSGPHDNVGAVIARLEAAVGEGNFDIVGGTFGGADHDHDHDHDCHHDHDEDDDEDVIDVEAVPQPPNR